MVYRCTRPEKASTADGKSLLDRLRETIAKAERIGVKGRDPEAIFLQKEEIITDLRALEREMVQAR